ncbi:MAG: acetyl-CoA carboxylase biotin carboxyl carrier protein [Eubacterium sp.]
MSTLEEYGKLFSDLGLTEMSVKNGEFELVLKKEVPSAKTDIELQNITEESKKENVAKEIEKNESNSTLEICSPLVGVFCSGEGPDAKPYVEVGDVVKKGDVVCTIEAMKMFNDVVADKDGIIKEICVENGSLVEFKQPLFRIEPID